MSVHVVLLSPSYDDEMLVSAYRHAATVVSLQCPDPMPSLVKEREVTLTSCRKLLVLDAAARFLSHPKDPFSN